MKCFCDNMWHVLMTLQAYCLPIMIVVSAEPSESVFVEESPVEVAQVAAVDSSMVVEPSDTALITLADALRLAHTQGRERKQRDEDLELVRLRLITVRGGYLPRWDASLEAGISGSDRGDDTLRLSGQVGVRQSLPTNGEVGVSLNASENRTVEGTDPASNARLSVNLSQPLWRGAGQLQWREQLTDAERAWLYAQRSHAIFLQDLSLRIASEFWRLQQQYVVIDTTRQAKERAQFTLDQARAFREIGRSDLNGVLRAEINVLRSQQNLIDAEAALAIQLDQFKIQLGLPPDQAIRIDRSPLRLSFGEVDAKEAITIALEQRLDLQTARDRVADSERSLVFARDALRPQVDLSAAVGFAATADGFHQDWDDNGTDYQASVRLTLPLDQRNERLSLSQSMVSLANTQRTAEQTRDRVIIAVQEALRALRSAESSLSIQQASRDHAIRRLIRSRLDYEAGQISNRDLVEAQSELQDAEIAVYRSQVDYLAAELRLRRETGVLMITGDGSWLEQRPDYFTSRPSEKVEQEP